MIKVKNTYRIIYIILGITGLFIQLGLLENSFSPTEFVYYTIQSNILCVIYFLLRFLYDNTRIKSREFREFIMSGNTKFAITMCITLTFLIYNFLLSDNMSQISGMHAVGNYLVHYIIPLLTIIDFLIFDKKEQNLKWYTPIVWLCIPLAYLIFILVRAPLFGNIKGTESPFPYPFIDLTIQPISNVVTNILIIGVIFIILGYILLFINKLEKRCLFKE